MNTGREYASDRELALQLATQSRDPQGVWQPTDIVAAAEMYLKFLRGDQKASDATSAAAAQAERAEGAAS